MTSSRRVALWTIAAGVAVTALGFRLILVRDLTNDHYMHLAWAQQVLFGEVPGRDFVDPGMPLMYGLSALVQWASRGPFSEAVLCCVLLAVANAVTCIVTAELTDWILVGLLEPSIASERRLVSLGDVTLIEPLRVSTKNARWL